MMRLKSLTAVNKMRKDINKIPSRIHAEDLCQVKGLMTSQSLQTQSENIEIIEAGQIAPSSYHTSQLKEEGLKEMKTHYFNDAGSDPQKMTALRVDSQDSQRSQATSQFKHALMTSKASAVDSLEKQKLHSLEVKIRGQLMKLNP